MRFFLGTGKYTPTVAVSGDMGWAPAFVKQWECICNHWNRMIYMDVGRVNKQVFYGLTKWQTETVEIIILLLKKL